ncbi:MAG TPA: hypothetical protein DCL75_16175 [Ktedonobacter sp.]|nr:hypothetical protein [Ktedonobacter sp.]
MDLECGEKLCLWGCIGDRLIIHSRVAIDGALLSQAIADVRGGCAVGGEYPAFRAAHEIWASKLGNHWAIVLRTQLSPRASRKRSRTRGTPALRGRFFGVRRCPNTSEGKDVHEM